MSNKQFCILSILCTWWSRAPSTPSTPSTSYDSVAVGAAEPYLFVYLFVIYLFIYLLFICCLFVCLFVCLDGNEGSEEEVGCKLKCV